MSEPPTETVIRVAGPAPYDVVVGHGVADRPSVSTTSVATDS